jgi:hypothetical protein
VVVDKIHMKGIGCIHTAAGGCHEYQSPYFTGLLKFWKIESEGPIKRNFGQT